ncbi:zinc finger protein [Elysia marginata]|uniref:Zinc finger protein n=1 Tax=Elysia marginata TaxID=1093978 RepID=A0AAV4JNV5_9GAST|nr:zinc finger protein [Elysia marginata]
MPSLELNSELDEVKASGGRGYILLYLDNKPSMRWRFHKSMKMKLEWDGTADISNVKKEKSSFLSDKKRRAQSQRLQSLIVSNLNHETKGQQINNTSVNPLSAPAISCAYETQSLKTESPSTITFDGEDTFDVASGNESDCSSFNVKGNFLNSTEPAHNPACKVEQDALSNLMESKTLVPAMQGTESAGSNRAVENKKTSSHALGLEIGKQVFPPQVTNNNNVIDNKMCKHIEANKLPIEKQSGLLLPKSKQGSKESLTQKVRGRGSGQKICRLCNKLYSTIEAHYQPPNRKLKCQSCSGIFQSQAHLMVHQYIFHDLKNTKMDVDNLAAETGFSSESTKTDICSDMKGNMKKRKYPCPVCGVKFRYCNLVNHVKNRHTKEDVFKCCICEKTMSNRDILEEHIRTHLGLEIKRGKIHCSLCPAVFSDRKSCNRHALIHKSFCVFCKKDFSLPNLLNEHYHLEHKDKLLSCRICGHQVATKRQLWTHERYHKYSKKVPCHICGIVISSTNMKAHLATHREGGEKGNGESSSTPNALDGGGASATANKYLCSMCPETFPTEGWLVRHMTTIHNQNMGFKCPQCPKRFSNHENLASHVRRHINFQKKSFTCTVCGKAFGSNHTLKAHMVIHAPVKSFICSICHQGFNYKVSLQSHMVSKHGAAK